MSKELDSMIETTIQESLEVKRSLLGIMPTIAAAAELLAGCYRGGGKLFFFGNGGSAADAQHLAAELVCRFVRERPPCRPWLHAVASDGDRRSPTTTVTWRSSPGRSRARPPRRRGGGITTSGPSKNVVAAARAAASRAGRHRPEGRNGGALAERGDVVVACLRGSPPASRSATSSSATCSARGSSRRCSGMGADPRPALFLDRDGVVNEEVGYLHRPEDVILVAGVADAIARFNRPACRWW